MKQIIIFLSLACSVIISIAQAPQSIPYQAVVRNTDGSIMANTAITMIFKIHDATATGTVVYEENQSATTNVQGLISLNVGNGSVVSGTFSEINWGAGSKFLHVQMNSGNGNIELGTQQMMSVPYSLYAENTPVIISNSGDTLSIGGTSVIVPGISAANPLSTSNYGYVLLPGNTTCQNEYISVTGCGGQDSLLYYDRYYSLIEIGGQCWFAENLATDKYSNGDNIPTGLTNAQWGITSAGAYAIYNNDLANDAIYGKLYNWYTSVDTRGVCPIGWHVPSDCEWMLLEGNLGMSIAIQQTTFYRGTDEGGKLKSTVLWNFPNNGATNSSGFTALPGGRRSQSGNYGSKGNFGHWWGLNEISSDGAIERDLNSGGSKIARDIFEKHDGLSIRCVRN